MEAIDRVKQYMRARETRPLRGADDAIHGLHMGEDFSGVLTYTDLKAVAAELDRLTAEIADLTAENTIIREHWVTLEGERNAADALCEEYRGEVASLRDRLIANAEEAGLQVAITQSAITRARAEGMEAAAVIAETVYAKEDMVIRGTGYDIAAHIRAAKGEQ